MIPCSKRDKKIALMAQDLIREFGRDASIEAFEGANAATVAGDKEAADFLDAVSKKIDEYYGMERMTISKAEADELFQLTSS